MKKVVAVSGGVDSVVLLDMLVKNSKGTLSLPVSPPRVSSRESWATHQESRLAQRRGIRGSETSSDSSEYQLIVAHFEHGIRGEASQADARFVEKLSQNYGVQCEIGYGNLTQNASEAEARAARYTFLKQVARKHRAQLVTAHHADDVMETIAINLVRGTGWRGLAVMGDAAISRPLLGLSKRDLYAYALQRGLEWVEDATNQTDRYLRNRLRRKISGLDKEARARLQELWQAQSQLRGEIDAETAALLENWRNSRYFFIMTPEAEALELLRGLTEGKLTRPQLQALLLGIKTAKAGTIQTLGAGLAAEFGTSEFIVKTSDRVL